MKFLIDFKNDAPQADIDAYLSLNKCTVVKTFNKFEEVYLVSSDTEPPVTDIVEAVIQDEQQPVQLLGVDHDLEPNLEYREFDVHDEKNWWKVASVLTPDFEANTDSYPVRGKGMVVYVVDSGLDKDHPEFANVDVELIHSFTGDFTDSTGHGTSLASVIAGNTCGMSKAKLAVVKVFGKNQDTLQSDLLEAFDAIWSDYVNRGKKGSVLNLSWSIPRNEFIESKIKKLIDAGIYAVCAAGNSGEAIGDVTPAAMSEMIVIGSYNQDFVPSDFSNYTGSSDVSLTAQPVNSGSLDGWAPGENIYVALPGGNYGVVSGTSIASAIHSACVAYNLTDLLVETGEICPCYGNAPEITRYVYHVGFAGRKGLLQLDGKYASSANYVTTFRTKTEDAVNSYQAAFKMRVSQDMCLNMVSGLNVLNISSDKDLPEGLAIDNGILVGKFTAVNGDVEYIELNFTLTLRDGGTAPYTAKIWLMSDNYDDTVADPTANPVINISPLVVNGCDPNTCVSNGCFYGCVSCSGDPKAPECICADHECI